MSYYFDEGYYLACKLAQLKAAGAKDAAGKEYTEASLKATFAAHGLTALEHYKAYGRAEQLNPNPYFNEVEYLHAKAKQINSFGTQKNPYGDRAWTADDVRLAIDDAGMTPVEHYEKWGAFETDASGRFINPSNAFDANAYWAAKLHQLQTAEPHANWTVAAMVKAFENAKVSPVSHYAAWGADEASESGIAYVQTVPHGQRMPNDPARDAVTGDIVPTNYMGYTPVPRDTNARPAQKPCDVGGLADESVSPPPVYPEHSAPVPDSLPPTIKDGPGVAILPPSTSGTGNVSDAWLVVDTETGKAVAVSREGAILGEADVAVTVNPDGSLTVGLPKGSNVPVNTLPPVDPNDLPESITPNPNLDNNYPEPPAPDTTGITAAFDADGDLMVEGSIKSTGASSVILDPDGDVALTGQANGAGTPGGKLGADKQLNAEAVTGSGTLTLDASACAVAGIEIYGSTTAKNVISAGKNSNFILGGENNDTITVASGAKVALDVVGDLGNDTITISGTVERFVRAASDDAANPASATDKDIVTVESGGVVGGGIAGGAGEDHITVKNGGRVGTQGVTDSTLIIFGGNGNDTIDIETGGKVYGYIGGGNGNDAIILADGATVTGNIELGAGNDELYLHSGAAFSGVIYGDDGTDTLFLTGTGTRTINAMTGVEALDFTATGAQTLTLGNTVSGVETLIFNDAEDKVTMSAAQFGGITAITGTASGAGTVAVTGGDFTLGNGLAFTDKLAQLAGGGTVTLKSAHLANIAQFTDFTTLTFADAGTGNSIVLTDNRLHGVGTVTFLAGTTEVKLSEASVDSASIAFSGLRGGDKVAVAAGSTAWAATGQQDGSNDDTVNVAGEWRADADGLTYWSETHNKAVAITGIEVGSITIVGDELTWQADTTGITAAFDADGGLMVTGSIKATGASSLTLDADGNVALTGQANGADTPDAKLGANKRLDARAVTGSDSGTLTLDASACEVAGISFHGSTTAKNVIKAGKNTNTIYGGKNNDTITVASDAKVAVNVISYSGSDTITISGTVEQYVYTASNDGGNPAPATDKDTVTVETGGVVGEMIQGGEGEDHITVKDSGTVGTQGVTENGIVISGGNGNDTITIETGGKVYGCIGGYDGDDTITLAAGATVTGYINLGAGDDKLHLHSGAAFSGTSMAATARTPCF